MLAIVNGRVYPIAGPPIDDGTVLIRDGRIEEVGSDVAIPPGTEILDAGGGCVLPGFIDAGSAAGLYEDGNGPVGHGANESTDPITPHLRALDGLWPDDLGLEDCRACGITTVLVNPGYHNVIGGQSCLIKTRCATAVDDLVLKAPAAMRCSLSPLPLLFWFWRGKRTTGDRSQDVALFEAALQAATEYREKKRRDEEAETDIRAEALLPVLEGEIPVITGAIRNHDIANAIELAEKWGFRLIIESPAEAPLALEDIKRSGAAVVLGPLTINRRGDARLHTLRTAALLHQAGVPFAFSSDHPTTAQKFYGIQPALAVREGLPEEAALHAMTLGAARLLGVDRRLGSLEPGKEADVVIMSGHPFDTLSQVQVVLIDGREVYRREEERAQ